MEKLRALYLKYLQHNLPKMNKEQLVEVVAPLLAKALNLQDEGQAEVIRESLVNDMNRSPDLWSDEEKRAILQGEQEVPPALPDGESDEDMYTPQSLEGALDYIEAILPTDEILQEDIDNASAVMAQLHTFLFTTEMPQIGIVDGTLAFGWTKGKRGVVLIYTEGDVFMQNIPSHGEGQVLLMDEEGKLTGESVEAVLKEIHDVKY